MRLRIDQEADLIECLFEAEAPAPDLCLRERTPYFKLVRREVSAQQLADLEVFVKAQVAIDRGVAIGNPLPADAGLRVAKIRGRLCNDAAELIVALCPSQRNVETLRVMEQRGSTP